MSYNCQHLVSEVLFLFYFYLFLFLFLFLSIGTGVLRHLKRYYSAFGWDRYLQHWQHVALYLEMRGANRSFGRKKEKSNQGGGSSEWASEQLGLEQQAEQEESSERERGEWLLQGLWSGMWHYFGFKTNEHVEATNADAPLCTQTALILVHLAITWPWIKCFSQEPVS